jgi:capsular polysaccharide export protein
MFDRLAMWLQQRGARVQRVAFQGGDVHDSRFLEPVLFKQPFADWPAFLGQLLAQQQTDCVVLFGQSRQYHKVAIELCKKQGLSVVVLEEGYFRPGFITMELNGVNGYSETLDHYAWSAANPSTCITPDISPAHYQKMAWQATRHYQALWKARDEFPHYTHHRISHPGYYAKYWVRSYLRKLLHLHFCSQLQHALIKKKSASPYYFVPLQHDGDAQIIHHSSFSDNAEFVIRVIRSFAQYAPAHTRLVFRQHPFVRGGPGHGELIAGLADALGIGHRVFHMIEGDSPVLAQHSAGVVVINSTVGLQALERGAPLIVMGEALYRKPGISFMGELDDFWLQARPADPKLTADFLLQIKNLTQAPLSVYALRDEPVRWDEVLDSSGLQDAHVTPPAEAPASVIELPLAPDARSAGHTRS